MSSKGSMFTKDMIFRWSLSLFVFMIPLSQFVSVRLLVLLTAFALFATPLRDIGNRLLNRAWSLLLYLLVLIGGLLYTHDMSTGLLKLETSFSLLAMPVVFTFLPSLERDQRDYIFGSFSAGVLVACVYCLVIASIEYFSNHDTGAFFFYRFTEPIKSHPTYFAYYLIASITYGLYVIFTDEWKRSKTLVLTCVLIFFGALILSSGTTTFVSLLLIFSFFILKFLIESRTAVKKVVFSLVVIMLIGLFALNTVMTPLEQSESDYWERSALWEAAIKANPNPLFGVGTGDYRTVINKYYVTHGLERYAADSFNAHNQFIESYLAGGLISFFALVVLLGQPLFVSARKKYALGILLMFPLIIYGITEVFLGRYQGVVFIALLHQTVATLPMSLQSVSLKTGQISLTL